MVKPDEVVRMPALGLAPPLPDNLPVTVMDPIGDENELPLRLTEADTGKTWLVTHDFGELSAQFWYRWQGEYFSIYRCP